ncbi:MAG: ATP-binding protein [SAR324 cluster bacterium]|nr:ATP-binding protein [SAR324 cluster bacterium]
MFLSRDLTSVFQQSRKMFPAVLITGPRQSGKTTFLKEETAATYCSFDDPLSRDFAKQDPHAFLDQFQGKPVILDEIQYSPSILPYLKMRIDQDRTPGQWLMTGSQQFHLMSNISESLAGRVAILELPPFSLHEVKEQKISLSKLLWNGFYPELVCFPEKRELWVKSYIQTYLERDVRQIEEIRNFRGFELFVQLCAAHHSQEFHPATLASQCGVSQPTIKSWSKVLEMSYLALLLQPYFNNFGKRIIKAPKFYFSDPALVAWMTRQPSQDALLVGNMGGALFEGMIISEAWKIFLSLGKKPSLYFWRSQGGLEVDLLIHAQGTLYPVEIKLTSTPTANHVIPLNQFKQIAEEISSPQGILVCNVDREQALPGNNKALPWWMFSEWMNELLS